MQSTGSLQSYYNILLLFCRSKEHTANYWLATSFFFCIYRHAPTHTCAPPPPLRPHVHVGVSCPHMRLHFVGPKASEEVGRGRGGGTIIFNGDQLPFLQDFKDMTVFSMQVYNYMCYYYDAYYYY